MKKVGFRLAELGFIGGVCSVAWWWDFYTKMQQAVGSKGELPIQCLYDGSGPCGLVANMASFAGVTPYQPTAFIVSAVVTVIGAVMYLGALSEVP